MLAPPDSTTWTSERTLRWSWDRTDNTFPHASRAACAHLIHTLAPHAIDAVAGLRTVTLHIDPLTADPASLEREALAILKSAHAENDAPPRTIEIPACFDPAFGPDLDRLPPHTPDLLAQADFSVRLFGFAPGFAYLTGLPDELRTPRLDTPRPRVAPGSIAIAEGFAAIYPSATPGGWNLVGRTPLDMFDHTRDEPSLLRVGDRVRFVPISRDEYEAARA